MATEEGYVWATSGWIIESAVQFRAAKGAPPMSDLTNHLGAWEGTWNTFLRPGEPYDESPVQATISRDNGAFVVEYSGSIAGEAVTGRLQWVQDGGTTTVEWADSWHTEGKLTRLEGEGGLPPSYQYGDDDPWTWDITIEASDSDVVVTHHNAGPGIPRYVGVLMKLESRRL